MKGILLAGGSGTRLYPATQVISKQLLPVGDKPMVYYPLSVLLQAGIQEVLVISTPRDLPTYQELLGDGSQFGMRLEYKEQPKPEGLAQAYLLAEEFLAGGPSCLILGDNVFYGDGLEEEVQEAAKLEKGGVIFGYRVSDPERYGVVEFDDKGNVLSIEEKPKHPKSHFALVGIYFFDGRAVQAAKEAKPSARGELEITEIQNWYLREGTLAVRRLDRGIAWLDTGTYESWLDASNFIMTIQKRQGLQVGCLEEIAYKKGFITAGQVKEQGEKISKTAYGEYLLDLASGKLDI
ncbi:MAG TPA: glucose-1-phosphate thymidylyltransferase RfbA [Verrucomicrobiae bacterium]|nr:glucose-1-phosphate thymidylyltransferase RfbA [Verrucomicrobiae bacterium]